MSIPYEALHTAALEFVPEGTIKKTTTWIAIVLNSVTKLKGIAKHDFLWLKCHPGITVRTIQHEYFTRHPLDGVQLQFATSFPNKTRQVKHLRKDNPIKDSNVVVLRAIEDGPDMQREVDAIALVKNQKAMDGRGMTSDDAIAVMDDSDEEINTSDSSGTRKRKLGEAQDSDSDDYKANKVARKHADGDDDRTDGEEHTDEEDHTAGYDPTYPEGWDWGAFLRRLNTLPAAAHDLINASPFATCTCGKQLLIKPWTCFSPAHTPLCTNCSAAQLQGMGLIVQVQAMHDMKDGELAEKHLQDSIGNAQNMDPDAGINYPFELGIVTMHLPVTSPEPLLDGAADSQDTQAPLATTATKAATPARSDTVFSKPDSGIAGGIDIQHDNKVDMDEHNMMEGQNDGPVNPAGHWEVDGQQDSLVNVGDQFFDDSHPGLTADVLQQHAAEVGGQNQDMRDFRDEFDVKHDSGSEASFKTAGEEDDDDMPSRHKDDRRWLALNIESCRYIDGSKVFQRVFRPDPGYRLSNHPGLRLSSFGGLAIFAPLDEAYSNLFQLLSDRSFHFKLAFASYLLATVTAHAHSVCATS